MAAKQLNPHPNIAHDGKKGDVGMFWILSTFLAPTARSYLERQRK